MLWLYPFSALVNAAASLLLGIFVYSQNRKSELHKYFSFFAFSVTFWSIGYIFWQLATEEKIALFWLRFLMLGAIFIPVLYFHFVSSLAGIAQKVKLVLMAGYIGTFVFAFFNLTTSYFIQSVSQKSSFLFWPNPGIFFHLFIIMFFGYAAASWYVLISSLKKTTGDRKNQFLYVFWGTFIGFLGGSTNYFLWYNINIPPVGNWAVAIYVGMIAYAIAKTKLFDIRIVATQFLIGIIAILLLFNIWGSQTPFEYSWKIGLLAAFLVAGYLLIRTVLNEIKIREQLQKAYEQLEKLDKAKSEFLSIASHQLRTPLTAIKGYISLILEGTYGKLAGKQEKPMENVYRSNERLIRLVNDLLNVSRIESGKIEMKWAIGNLEDTIQSLIEELKVKAQEKNLKLVLEKSNTPLPKLRFDEEKMRNVLINLLDNAIRYTDKGSVSIRTENAQGKVRIMVSDTGEGMTQNEISNLFKSFWRGSAGMKGWTEGTGLGLYIASQFVQLHGGKIWAESPGKGKGSTFTIEIPSSFDGNKNNRYT